MSGGAAEPRSAESLLAGWQVEAVAPMVGLAGWHQRPVAVPMWRVDDIASAVARVGEAGGQATEPESQPYGLMADCTDDHRARFHLGQL